MHISVVIMLDAVESDGASLSEPSSGGTLWRRGHYTCRRDGDTGEPTTNDVVDPVLIKIQARERNGGVQGVDTRSQRIAIQQSNGQSVWIRYDNNTQVVYQNQNYSPTALENGDQVTANIQDAGNGSYYTSYVLVNQSVRGSNGGQPGNVQTFQGTVRQVDRQNGAFAMDESNFGRITVVLANGVSRADVDRFNTLRAGDFVRFYGYSTGNSAVQLRQFY